MGDHEYRRRSSQPAYELHDARVPAPVPGRNPGRPNAAFAHPSAAAARTVRAAHGAVARTELIAAELTARLGIASAMTTENELACRQLGFELAAGLRRAEMDLAALERTDPTRAGEIGDAIAEARARLVATAQAHAPLLARAARAVDEHAQQWRDDGVAMADRLGLSAPHIRHDADAAVVTGAHGARGVALGETVYLHPEAVTPSSDVGREILAHELIHLAQARLPAGTGGGRAAAEREATSLAPVLARGGTIPSLRHAIDLREPAGDGDADRLPDAPSRYGVHVTLAQRDIGRYGRLSATIQAYAKDGEAVAHGKTWNADTKASVAAQEALIKVKGDKVSEQIATSIVKIENVWDLKELSPLPGLVDLKLKLETKLFDATFSADDVSVDLAKIAFVGEADITKLILDGHTDDAAAKALATSSTIKLTVRAEIRFPAEIVADLYRLHRAKQTFAAAKEAEIAKDGAKRALAKAKKRAAKYGLGVFAKPEVLEELAAAETRFAKAKKVWDAAKKGVARAAETMKSVGGRLAKTAAGRAASRLAVAAMRAIPVLNAFMIAQDLIEAGTKVIALLEGNAEFRLGGGDGGGAEEGSDEEGNGKGTEEVDSDKPAGSGVDGGGGDAGASPGPDRGAGGSKDARPDDATQVGANDVKGGAVDGKGGTVTNPEVTEADFEAPTHHPVAAEILRALEVDAGQEGTGLSPEDARIVDEVIPPDLDPTERAELLAYVQGARGGEQGDLVTSLVSAMEYVRPNGARRADAVTQPQPVPQVTRRRSRRRKRRSGPIVIDPRETLRRGSKFTNGSPPQITLPAKFEHKAMKATVTRLGAHVNLTSDVDTATVEIRLDVTWVEPGASVWIETEEGLTSVEANGHYVVRLELAQSE